MRIAKPVKTIAPLPLSWLIHEIAYSKYNGEDRHNEASYEDAITIKNVRVDYADSSQLSGLSDDDKFESVIYVDAKNSTNVPNGFVNRSKITFKERDYKIVKAIPLYGLSDEVHHWELEVI